MAVEHVDLIGLLKTFGNKGIEKSKIYGKITRRLERPSNLQSGVVLSETGIFVEMSVFAVNLSYYESYLKGRGVWNKDGIYMANGDVIAYVDSSSINLVQNDWYTIDGTIRFGSKSASPTYVCIFNFYKTRDSKWGISPCRVSDLDISDWDKHSQYYAWMSESGRVGAISHPSYVKSLPKFNSMPVEGFRPIENNFSSDSEMPVSVSKGQSYFKKESRTSLKQYNDNVDKFESCLLDSKSARKDYINNLKTSYAHGDDDKYLDYMVNGLKKNLKKRPSPLVMTGRVILRKYLDNFKGASDDYAGTKAGIYLSDIFDEIALYIKDHKTVVSASDVAWDLCKSAFSDKNLFYGGVVGIVLGIPFDTIKQIWLNCDKNSLSLIKIFNENPYILQFVSPLSYNEIERIALCFNKHSDKELDSYRNISMLHAFVNDSNDGSTIYTKDMIMRSDIGVVLTKARYDSMNSNGTYLSSALCFNIQEYLIDISSASLRYTGEFKKKGYQYVKAISTQDLLEAINQYSESGLGIVIDNFVTSGSMLEEELFVFKTMYELGKVEHDYDSALIDKYIEEYEGIVGFKLEEMQRYAVHLLTRSSFIVAGGAGSGKTTVSNCIVYVLKKLEPDIDIQFAAPTGKAAKRMQEVVHKEVKTLHSKFKLGVADESVFDKDNSSVDFGSTAFFFDECAMVTIELLYKVLRKIDTTTSRIFMFGDFNQLPPIGKGLPFKNLLRFMPCVFLNVTKRAVEGSKITANSNYINEYSDAGNWHQLESGDDFFLLPCKGNQIQRVVKDLCAYYLGKTDNERVSYISKHLGLSELPKVSDLTEDDIQVVSPLSKANYLWGTTKLNEVLEPLFNSSKSVQNTFVYKLTNTIDGSAFSIGDRVIHVDKNMYSMQWYSTYEDGVFQKIYGCGICNGEVGKVVDFVKADTCDFHEEVEQKPDEFEYYESLRDDSTWVGDDKWFIVVEYYDYISDRNFYILYRAEDNMTVQDNRGIVLKGDDLSKLNLFYAGTTHKLQGSQNKIIICVLDDVNYTGFITRQMLYTMITRGIKLVFAVGSVGNERTSMLSKARMDIASSNILTIGELFI